MNTEITDMLRSLNNSGRQRLANADHLAPLEDEYMSADGSGEETHAARFLRLLRRLSQVFHGTHWCSFIQGRVWWSVSVYAPRPLGELKKRSQRFTFPVRVLQGRARVRVVRGEEKMEWQTRFNGGTWLAAEARTTMPLEELIVGHELANGYRSGEWGSHQNHDKAVEDIDLIGYSS